MYIHTCTCRLLNDALAAAQVLQKMDRKNKTFTTMSTTEYTALPLEFGLATSALIMSARKLVKKITRHPCVWTSF